MHGTLVILVAFASTTAAIKYTASFTGGTGCAPGGVIQNGNCTIISPNTMIMPRQATNGAGVLCYDSPKNCNSDCPQKDCYPDQATCATGFAGTFPQNIWICPGDMALFTASTTPPALPNGNGAYCFKSILDCETATNTSGQCKLAYSDCATGQAGPTSYNFIHSDDFWNPVTGVSNGAGILCFDNRDDCEASNNNVCGPPPAPARCTFDVTTCSTGIVGPVPNVGYTCLINNPPGSAPNGGGQLCYDTYANCVGGPNACGDNSPCMLDYATCSTGAAGPTSNNYFCPQDMTTSLPNGGGQLCYDTVENCVNGPNYCDRTTCVKNTATCGTGVVGPTDKNIFCQLDQPQTLTTSPNTPGSLPNAAGGNCYYSQIECLTSPNACKDATTECLPDYSACSTGQAGPSNAWFYCQKDTPPGAVPDGGGQLCYGAAGQCLTGPNACGLNTPCTLDFATCSTGPVGPTSNNWFCDLDNPVGSDTNRRALSTGSGMLCWDSLDDCYGGPNACTKAAGDCVNNNVTLKTCSSGMAAGNSLGNNIACLKDFPTGAVVNAAGKWCYDTLSNCLNGTNACNKNAPCVKDPATVCATAGAANPYYCASDYPVDVTKGLTSVGNLCYQSALACMNGPNACNMSIVCQNDTTMSGACKGAAASYSFYCAINSVGAAPVQVSSAPGTAPVSSLATVMAGAALLVLLTSDKDKGFGSFKSEPFSKS